MISILFSNLFFAQKLSNYYLTTDIVTFKNPVIVVPDNNKIGVFIVESENFEKERNIKKLFTQKKAFLFDTESFGIESYNDRKKINYKDFDYEYSYRKEEEKTIILKLDDKIRSFFIGFVKLQYYNHINASAHSRTPYIKNTDNYEMVLIPSFIE
jgi:hypothetical protein